MAAMVLIAAVTLLGAPAAQAHTELKSSEPASGASLATAPTTITLTFEEDVTLPPGAITVTGPAGATWTVGSARADGAVVTAPVQANGPAGAYTVAWKVRADDGDLVTGTVPFTMTTASGGAASSTATTASSQPAAAQAPASPAPSAQNTAAQGQDSGGLPTWAWILIVVVIIVILGGIVASRRRSDGP
jgi:hypothetical protein